MVRASCSHDIEYAQAESGAVYVKDFNREGKRAMTYLVLCPKCIKSHQRAGLLLKTERSKRMWLNNKPRRIKRNKKS